MQHSEHYNSYKAFHTTNKGLELMVITSLWPVLSQLVHAWVSGDAVSLVLIALKDSSHLSLGRGSETARPTRELVNKCAGTQWSSAKPCFGSAGRLTDT